MSKDHPPPASHDIETLRALMRRLRAPEGGCPWDRAQSFATIAPYTIEEAYEVADAIERQDMPALADELGDLLFQVVFYAQMAEEAGSFSFSDVVSGVVAKMIRRHPHVFGDARVESAAAQTEAWEHHKAAERRAKADGAAQSALDGVPVALPALLRATKLQKRMARVGFDWPAIDGVLSKIREELAGLEDELGPTPDPARVADEFGDLLFACANLGRFLGADAETALRGANAKVERRFRGVEAALQAQGRTAEEASLSEMDTLWDAVKQAERD